MRAYAFPRNHISTQPSFLPFDVLSRFRLRRVGAAPPPDRSFELWKVPATGPTVSLGVADSERELKPLDVALAPGERLAISVEPKGGSPTGQATGPVVYLGTLLPAE